MRCNPQNNARKVLGTLFNDKGPAMACDWAEGGKLMATAKAQCVPLLAGELQQEDCPHVTLDERTC